MVRRLRAKWTTLIKKLIHTVRTGYVLKPAEPRSILPVGFAVYAAAAILLGCVSPLYFIVVRHALEEDQAVLRDKLFAVPPTWTERRRPALGTPKILRGGESRIIGANIDATGACGRDPGMERSAT
jgi:hypothetical protein